MNENETVNERRVRENAARIAAIQQGRAVGRPTVPTRDDIVLPTFDDYNAREAANAETIAKVQRAQTIDWMTRKLGRVPTEAEITSAMQR
jgi:hypothetical protein